MHRLEESTAEIDVFEALLEREFFHVDWGILWSEADGTEDKPSFIQEVSEDPPAISLLLVRGLLPVDGGDPMQASYIFFGRLFLC